MKKYLKFPTLSSSKGCGQWLLSKSNFTSHHQWSVKQWNAARKTVKVKTDEIITVEIVKKKKKSLSGNEVSVLFFSPAYPLFHFVLTYLSISHFSQSKISLLTSLQFSGSILVSLFQLLPFLSSLSASLSHWASLCLYLDLTFPALCLLEIETKNSMFSLSFISLYGTKRYPQKS